MFANFSEHGMNFEDLEGVWIACVKVQHEHSDEYLLLFSTVDL